MKSFTDALTNIIMENEIPRLDKIMQEVAQKIQMDMVNVTYGLIDAYYQDYKPDYYIRTDNYKAKYGHPKDKKSGQFRKKNKEEWKRASDISLASAIKALGESGQPAIGVCRPIDGMWGYQAGVIFDPNYFNKAMYHEQKGFTEWDIVENFLFGQHGNGKAIHFTEPHADIVLKGYIDSYKTQFDKHYNDACKKFK